MSNNKDFDPSIPLDNAKHERFIVAYFDNGGNGTQAAITAGYAENSAHNQAKRLIKDDYVLDRLLFLRNKEWEGQEMGIAERRARLSNIGRADASDYLDAAADGSWIGFGKDSPNTQAVKSIECKTTEDGTVVTKLQLHDPRPSMAELNKMDGAYAPEKHEHGFAGDVNVITQIPEPDPLPDHLKEDAD